jgi:hypothetical protein
MSNNTHRIPITVNGENYARMRRQLASRGQTVSGWALEMINEELGEPATDHKTQHGPRPTALDSVIRQGNSDFASYFEAHERERARLLGLMPGEPVPPLNSKAQRRIEPS